MDADGFGVCFEMGKKCSKMRSLYITSLWVPITQSGICGGNKVSLNCKVIKYQMYIVLKVHLTTII